MQNIIFNKQARDKLLSGVNQVADAVRITMGPFGKVVVLDRPEPEFTLDGVTVARSIIELKDPVENMGANLIKSVAKRVNDLVGDGTTTATVLTRTLLSKGLAGVDSKLNPLLIKKAFEDGTKVVIEELKKASKQVKTKRQMSDIATISSRDREIGDVIAEIYSKLGPDGLIETEEVATLGMSYEIVQGTQIDSGWFSPYLITNPDRNEAVIESPYVLVTTKVLDDAQALIPLLEAVYQTEKKALVIIGDSIEGEALLLVLRNKVMGKLKLSFVKAPGYGDQKLHYLTDVATLTGAQLISENSDFKLEEFRIDNVTTILGKAGRIVSTKAKTIIVDGKGKKSEINKHIARIKNEMEDEKTTVVKWGYLRERHARLSGGVAIIRTGSISETESKEKRYRIEDAVNATKSAIKEGIVQGAGFALLNASKVLNTSIVGAQDHSYRFGLEALQLAIRRPAEQILENAGYDSGVILAQHSKGFDSLLAKPCDLFTAGIIDPLKVERVALENAVSVVGMLLITGAVIWNEKEELKTNK